MSEPRPNYYRVRVPVTGVCAETVPTPDGFKVEKTTAEIECFDLIDALGLGFYAASAFTYLFRSGRKTSSRVEDMQKAAVYCTQSASREP